MSSTITNAPRVNGDTAASAEAQRITDFYEKLFQLRDEVFAGKHPRIKLPDSVLEKVAPQPVQNTSLTSSRPITNGSPNGNYLSPSRPDSSSFQYQPAAPFISQLQNGQRPFSAKSTSSGIDPVLLTKSEHLIRAEIQLKRQQIERILKDQVDKRGQNRDRDLALDAESRVDVDELLAKAQELVKPFSGLQLTANGNSDATDSFDENSYYSSKANSWSSDEADSARNVNADAVERIKTQSNASNHHTRPNNAKAAIPDDRHLSHPENPTFTDIDEEEPYEPGDDLELYEPAPILHHEDREESEYSPPPAGDSLGAHSALPDTQSLKSRRDKGRDIGHGANSSMNGYGYNRPLSPTSPSVPVIRNQIGTPVAPQPSRVSPLAFAKVPRIDQGRHHGPHISGGASPRQDEIGMSSSHADHASPRTSRRQSPSGPTQNIQNPRKRRREERRNRAANKRVARSPEPYIKEEPMSPPPFASYSDPQPTKRRVIQPLSNDVEIISSRDARTQPVYYRDQEPVSIPRTYRTYEEPSSPTVVRVPSRIAHRRLERDDQDLRRVASVQYARRPYSPSGPEFVPYSANETRQIRAASHAYVDRPAQPPIYREASVRPSAAPRYVRETSRSPIQEYLPRAQSPMMAPPSRRIVMDQYGNQYYAAPMEIRESVAPPSRRMELDPYYERALPHETTVRVRATDPYEEEHALQRMPPPPLRRYAEPSDMEVVEAQPRAHRQREYSIRPAETEYPAVREVVERRPVVYQEEMPPPREYATRSFSVRPEVVRTSDYATRHESVQPGYVRRSEVPAQRYREVSIQQDPYDDRRYVYATKAQGRRYVDEQAGTELTEDSYAGEGRRVSYRY